MKATFIKRDGGLFPSSEEAATLVGRVPDGREVMLEFKRPRSPRQHNLFWGLMRLLVDNADLFETVEAARIAVMTAIGQVDVWIDPVTFETSLTPKSIAWESCKQDEFNSIFEASLRVICNRYLGGTDMDVLRERVFEMVDGPRNSSLGTRLAA